MILELHIPSWPLGEFIASFLYYKDFRPEHAIDRLLPDGNVTLLIELTGAPQHVYDNDTLKESQLCRNAWFSGNRNGFITIPSCRDIEMFVVNFHKGKSFPFLRDPLLAYTNCIVDAEIAFSNTILELRETLLSKTTPAAMFDAAEHYFLTTGKDRMELQPCIDFAVTSLTEHPGQQTLQELSEKIGYSQKHFIQLFKTHVGITPKAFMRIMRFQHAIREVEQKSHFNWTEIAFQAGYYDQAHFIHDFKKFAGFTPGEYLARKNAQLNYVPVE